MVRLFRSKLMPPVDRGYLPRPRLLAGDPGARLVVVQAPAGAGKSTLLRILGFLDSPTARPWPAGPPSC